VEVLTARAAVPSLIAVVNSATFAPRAVTSETTCPDIAVDGKTQTMMTRAAATLPLFPVLSCEAQIPAGTAYVSIEQQSLMLFA